MQDHWFHPHPSDEESAKQRLDRNFGELLQELRVAQTGVQILLGFLLTMVFAARFTEVKEWELWLYAASVCLTTLAMGLLVAPVSIHRILFRRGLKPQLVRLAHLFMSAGLVALLLSVSTAVTLALTVALGTGPGLTLGVIMAIILVSIWYALPVYVRAKHLNDNADD